MAWLDERFHLIRYEDDELPSVDWVLDLARAAVLRWVHRTASGQCSAMVTSSVRLASVPGVHCLSESAVLQLADACTGIGGLLRACPLRQYNRSLLVRPCQAHLG